MATILIDYLNFVFNLTNNAKWRSSHLNRDMALKVYGHWGKPIIVCVGQGAWENEAIEDTRYLDYLFREKFVPSWIDYWGHDVKHDWPWWYRQMNYFLGHLLF